MADRRRNDERDDGWGFWGKLALGVSAVAAAAGAAVVVANSLKEEEEQSSRQGTSQRAFRGSTASQPRVLNFLSRDDSDYYLSNSESDAKPIIIAVDATKTRGGGLLLLPAAKAIYFYSVDWSDTFDFPDHPDKFELVNATLSLEVFRKHIKTYRQSGTRNCGPLIFKIDNQCATDACAYSRPRNEQYKIHLAALREMVKSPPFSGSIHCFSKKADEQIKIADKLSRGNCTSSDTLPDVIPAHFYKTGYGYSLYNVSEDEMEDKLKMVAAGVPPELLKETCYQPYYVVN